LEEGRNLMTIQRGSALFKHAVHAMASAGRKAMEMADIDAAAIAWWIPHQANIRIIRTPEAFSYSARTDHQRGRPIWKQFRGDNPDWL